MGLFSHGAQPGAPHPKMRFISLIYQVLKHSLPLAILEPGYQKQAHTDPLLKESDPGQNL
jgi:hypothetical protein